MANSSSNGGGPAPVGSTEASPPVTIAHYFHNQELEKLYIYQQQQQAEIARRDHHGSSSLAASAAGGSRLPTLVEASHINALNEATGPAPAGLPRQLENAVDEALAGLSAPQRALAQAKEAGYGLAVMELANEDFRQRWEHLCLASSEIEEQFAANGIKMPYMNSGVSQAQSATLHPPGWASGSNAGGLGGSWEFTSASAASGPSGAGGRGGMARSSSRSTLPTPKDFNPSEAAQARALFEAQRRKLQLATEAEEWRKNALFRRTELNLTRLEDSEGIVAMAPAWLELDSSDEGIRLDSEIALQALITYASYLAISTFILPPPSSDPSRRHLLPHYARAINAALNAGPGGEGAPSAGSWMTLAVRLPISSPHSLAQLLASRSSASMTSTGANAPGSSGFRAGDDWAYESWTQIRHLCGYHARLSVLLDLSMPLPSTTGLSRWQAEPVTNIWLPASSFLANAKGFPVLSKAVQSFLRALFRKAPKPLLVLSGTQDPPSQHTRGGPTAYMEYIRHLERTAPPEGAVVAFARGYADWLQAPLQPLMDNLEGATYEVFERDPVKYALYEEAVRQALVARPAGEVTVIWVCGAGRGPLVSRCLAAASAAARVVKIVALEKNPSAMITLQEKQVKEWGTDIVELRFGDMRTAERPAREEDRADILVSELLGSFGDNELSPECLDGGCRFLKSTGVSIPSSYTSYITPLSSAKLHNEILSSGNGSAASSSGPSSSSNACASNAAQIKAAETPFVVLFGSVDLPAIETPATGKDKIQECWSYAHGPIEESDLPMDATGLPISNSHNVRTTSHSFTIGNASVIHGLAGYFEAHLYGDVMMSIHPDPARGSADMLSWFPIFFPLKEPLYVPAGAEVDVHLWRLTTGRKVWYEWSLESFLNITTATAPGGAAGVNGNRPISAISTDTAYSRESPVLASGASGLDHHAYAFANAPHTPRVPSSAFHDGGQNRRLSGGSQHQQARLSQQGMPMEARPTLTSQRIKIGMTTLQNPQGRSSWVGM